jgi:hypothetical protein
MSNETEWLKLMNDKLAGRKIVKVRLLTKEEAEDLGWYSRSVVLHLDDGNLLYPSRDDEGNDAGALFTNDEELSTLPVFGL